MDAWKPAGQIDGLFERTVVPVESKNPLSAPAPTVFTPRQTSRTPEARNVVWPGARRRSLIVATLIFPFLWHYALDFSNPFLIKQFGQGLIDKILPFSALVPLVVLLHFVLKRLMNLGMSRVWCLAILVPFLNLWLGYRCYACPAGFAEHKRLEGRGIALAILYWLAALSVILAAAFLFDLIDNSAIEGQLRGLIRRATKLISPP